jgi:hypothetical protein
VTNLSRILQADFEFYSDGAKLYLANVSNFIYEQLEGQELTLVHDRYKPLEELSLHEIALTKQEYDSVESS